ncbi:dipeptide/oligopeptide/nickel ABC transporter permease/ATP-binding protein [Demequina sp. NBRC 110051]|uniref:dipeptide/oligopeptide/nickel ABC transporter permease/ATP-binding protein n=1 Tax=Demequina sp. NBRC 110051 TaxID=1570340 RepID=UPI000A051746|nr:dipeptide/oligopeptide/nickel ABC transporter permease/ATP-binding protein [Demequina sp. NBRC 110051]
MTEITAHAPAPVAARRRFRWNGTLVTGLAMFAAVILVAIIAPFFYADQAAELTGESSLGSVPGHPLGTDTLGRDMLARTLVATRTTVLMALAATALAAAIGVGFGIAVWLAPRRLRNLGLRLIEFFISYPGLLLAIIVAAILGQGAINAVIAVAAASIAGFARLTANLASGIAARQYVSTARLLGVPAHRIALRHVLPNMAEPMLIITAQAFAGALVEISGLSFVGLGTQAPYFDYGTLLADSLSKIMTNPILLVGPALAIVIVSMSALFIGDGLAAAANPRSNAKQSQLTLREGETSALSPADDDALLVADGVTVTHIESGRELVSDVSFTIRRGEIVGIVGESGSGKSLTASVASRLLADGLSASVRRLTLGDTDLTGKVPPAELASRIGLVYQDPGTALNPALTLGSQLSDVLRTRMGMNRREARRALLAAFKDVLMPDPEGRLRQNPHELSGGMNQRAMIASAMSVKPELLIADEPTTALDVTVQREVLTLINRLNTERGTAVLFISHDLGVVRRLCDRVLVMQRGQIVEQIDDMDNLTVERAAHPYTRQLLAATPSVRLEEDKA